MHNIDRSQLRNCSYQPIWLGQIALALFQVLLLGQPALVRAVSSMCAVSIDWPNGRDGC